MVVSANSASAAHLTISHQDKLKCRPKSEARIWPMYICTLYMNICICAMYKYKYKYKSLKIED